MDPLLTPPEVAKRLTVSQSVVRRLARSGELPSLKIGGSRRFDPADVDAYVNAQKGSKLADVVELRGRVG